jgi:hypothetical protein
MARVLHQRTEDFELPHVNTQGTEKRKISGFIGEILCTAT